jgi:hypothetical protein
MLASELGGASMFFGIVLIAIGIGALFDLRIWPIVFIAIGVSMLGRVVFGSKRRSIWSNWSCWGGPSFRERDKDKGQATD